MADLREFFESGIDSDLTFEEINLTLVDHMIEKGWARPITPERSEFHVTANVAALVGRLGTLAAMQRGEWDEVTIETSLILRRGEEAYFEQHAVLLKEVAQREYRGGSRGWSIPIGSIQGRSVRYRVGSYRGHLVNLGTDWVPADSGTMTVTNERVVYRGQRKTLEFQYSKLVSLEAYSDAIDLAVSNRQATSCFRVDDPACLASIIRAAVEHSLR
jgi:hypothetical protein